MHEFSGFRKFAKAIKNNEYFFNTITYIFGISGFTKIFSLLLYHNFKNFTKFEKKKSGFRDS